MNILKAKHPVEAWEKVIERFLLKDNELFKEGEGYTLTNSLFTYDLSISIADGKFNPDFDFGSIFGYTQTKWSGLLSNYFDLDVLDQARDMIRKLEENKVVNRNYHIGFNFSDNNNNGKSCLLGGIFSRKIGVDKPEITILLRSSDIVTRLPMDLLLFSRMGEYVYGHTDFSMMLNIKAAWADDTAILMYDNYKDISEVMKGCEDSERKKRIRRSYKKLKNSDEAVYKTYGHSFRAFKALRKDLGYKLKPLKAENLIIGNWDGIPLPHPCPSVIKRNMIKKALKKFSEKYGFELRFDKQPANTKKKLITFSAPGEDDLDDIVGDDEETKTTKEKKTSHEAKHNI